MKGVDTLAVSQSEAWLRAERAEGGGQDFRAVGGVELRVMASAHATAAAAMTTGFRAGFAVSAGLLAAAVIAALALLREDGRGQNINLIELQAAA